MRKLVFFVVLLTFAAPDRAVTQVVPRSREVVEVDYIPPPATLEVLWDSADVVVIAHVLTLGPPFLNQFKSVERIHQLRVVEILKGPDRFPSVFKFRQFGGTVTDNGVEVSTSYPGGVQLAPGDEVLLFLGGEDDGALRAAFGPAGLFEIRRLRDASQPMGRAEARVPAAAQRIQDLKGRQVIRLEEFEQKLRAYRGHRANKK